MTALVRVRWALWMALALVVLWPFEHARAQTDPAGDIVLVDGRLTMNVRDVSLSEVLRTIATKGEFALDIAGELDSKVTASFEKVPLESALRRLVGRSSYIIELAPPAGPDATGTRRIAKLSVFARSAPARVGTSSTPRGKRAKGTTSTTTKSRRDQRRDADNQRDSRRRARSPGS